MRVILVFSILLIQLMGYSQSKKQLLQIANNAYTLQDYYSAVNLYENYLEAFPEEIEVKFLLSKSYIELNDFQKSIEPLNQIYKVDRDRKFPNTSLLLANAYKQTANYRYAKRFYRRALTKYRRQRDSYEFKKINQELESCNFAQANYSIRNHQELNNLGASINSTNADFAFTQIDSNTAIFAATDTFGNNAGTIAYSKLFMANRTSMQWYRTDLIIIPEEYAKHNVVNPFYDETSGLLYFSVCDTLHQCIVMSGEIDNGNLSNIQKLNDQINLPNSNNTQPAIAIIESDKYLLFSSNRIGGMGGMDIWYSKLSGNNFESPINLGNVINSPDHEITPFYKKNTLYFSSNWHQGFGGFDVFKSVGNLNTQSEVKNLLQPINSISNDLYYRQHDQFVYLTTNRTGSMTFKNDNCCNDIYYTPILADSTTKAPEETFQSINSLFPLVLYFDNDSPKKNSTDTTTSANFIDLSNQYINRKSTYVTQNLKGLKKEEAIEIEDELLDFFDFQIPQGQKQLEEIKAFILKETSNNEGIKLIVKGYSSTLSNTDYNFKLSQRRINSLYNYFRLSDSIKHGEGRIEIIALPMGDLVSTEDKKNQKKENRIYGLDAIYQRKIELVGLASMSPETEKNKKTPSLALPNELINLGKIESNVVKYKLIIQNTGSADLELYKIIGEGVKKIIFPRLIIPNESTTVEIQFDFSGVVNTDSIMLYFITNEVEKLKTIEFRFQLSKN